MQEKYLVKLEISLPIKITTKRIHSKIINLFAKTNGVGGCTYSLFTRPAHFKGKWVDSRKRKVIDDYISIIYGCYNIEKANISIEDLIKQIKQMIEREGGEDLAWIVYSQVACLTN